MFNLSSKNQATWNTIERDFGATVEAIKEAADAGNRFEAEVVTLESKWPVAFPKHFFEQALWRDALSVFTLNQIDKALDIAFSGVVKGKTFNDAKKDVIRLWDRKSGVYMVIAPYGRDSDDTAVLSIVRHDSTHFTDSRKDMIRPDEIVEFENDNNLNYGHNNHLVYTHELDDLHNQAV